jgi:hypothetical protein
MIIKPIGGKTISSIAAIAILPSALTPKSSPFTTILFIAGGLHYYGAAFAIWRLVPVFTEVNGNSLHHFRSRFETQFPSPTARWTRKRLLG